MAQKISLTVKDAATRTQIMMMISMNKITHFFIVDRKFLPIDLVEKRLVLLTRHEDTRLENDEDEEASNDCDDQDDCHDDSDDSDFDDDDDDEVMVFDECAVILKAEL